MSEQTQAGSSLSAAPGAPSPPPARRSLGGETVINPERQKRSDSSLDRPLHAPAPGTLGERLFPQSSSLAIHGADTVQLGHFRIESRIHTGGMGAVFRAMDLRLNRIVALKVLPPSQSHDSAAVERFRNEAQAAARLDHENIARVYYIGEDQGLHFIAFEYITGTNLRDWIEQVGRLDPGDAVSYTLQIAAALVHTSAHGVVHRDIKPSNIIITPSGRAKLVDLGLARNESRSPEDELTVAGTTLGTFDYISPEQAKDPRSVDVRSDIYSLGCTLYHMLTGEPPYPEGTMLQKLLDHQGKEVPDPRAKNRKVSEDLASIVRKMMSSEPRKRPQTAELLVRDLLVLAGAMGLRSATAEGLVWLSGSRDGPSFWERHIGWIATVSALLVIVGWLKYTSGPPPESNTLAMNEGPAFPQAVLVNDTGASQKIDVNLGKPSNVDEADTVRPEPIGRRPDRRITSQGDGPKENGGASDLVGPRDPSIAFAEPPTVTPAETVATPIEPEEDDIGDEPNRQQLGPPGPAARRIGEFASNTAGNSRPGDRENSTRPMPTVASTAESAIAILASEAGPERAFPTLEAACSAAADGNVVELRFNGPRREEPLRITSKITIRAGRGFHPVLELVPREIPAEGYQTRMITVTDGSLDLVDVGLVMAVRDDISTDQWALFSVQRPERIRLQGAAITLHNPRGRPAVMAEFKGGLNRSMMDMEMQTSNPSLPPEFELYDCIIRGGGDLFLSKQAEGRRLILNQCIVALDGALLREQGAMDVPNDVPQIDLRIDHVTAVVNSDLVRMESGSQPRKLIPVRISATNNILSTTSTEPLVYIEGNSSPEDLRRLLKWTGQKNFYDRFETFWLVSSADSLGRPGSMDFTSWKRHWGLGTEVDAHADSISWRRQWNSKPFSELVPSDFALDASGSNLAVSGANNGTDAGADLELLGKLPVAPYQSRD
jgi:serine/threonine-protein kinase